ncbi:MAG: FKBP-type peptidyl-prolyl cis-trans isomerase [Rubripirellula sp.]
MFTRLFMLGASSLFCLTTTFHVAAQDGDAKKTVADPVGYFLGLSVGQQMRQSGFRDGDLDINGVMAGFQDGLDGKPSALTDEQLQSTQEKIQTLLQARRATLVKEQKEAGVKFLTANAKKEGVKSLEDGVQYKVLTAGKGESPALTDTVKVHYTGKLINGTVFDSSVQRGEPATFRVGQVIKGWQSALQKMKVGDKWMIYIPSDLGYGERGAGGSIGPNEVLTFEVELLEIQ